MGTDARQPWNLNVNHYSIASVHHSDGVMMVYAHTGYSKERGQKVTNSNSLQLTVRTG